MEKEDENYSEEAEGVMVDYVIPPHEHHNHHQQLLLEPGSGGMNVGASSSSDRGLSFADVMQFADFGPKLGLHPPLDEHHLQQDSTGGAVDSVNFLKFPVLNKPLIMSGGPGNSSQNDSEGVGNFIYDLQENNNNANIYNNPVQLEFLGNSTDNNVVETAGEKVGQANIDAGAGKAAKRKRPRTVKTSEEVESQRMTHIAVERNRRKQMNEHLRVLRSLMPSSYVQRGDQASIIGGAIEFVRELEQLLQCLESQKRRRLYGDQGGGPSTPSLSLVQQQPVGFPPAPLQTTPSGSAIVPSHYQDDPLRAVEMDPSNCATGLLWEETAESKSTIADVEVKMSGFNALIKILSRRRPGQLIKLIADLEDLHFSILHTNITTIEQTVLYSFNVQVSSEARFTAEDIASSVQQIFTFIHVNTSII